MTFVKNFFFITLTLSLQLQLRLRLLGGSGRFYPEPCGRSLRSQSHLRNRVPSLLRTFGKASTQSRWKSECDPRSGTNRIGWEGTRQLPTEFAGSCARLRCSCSFDISLPESCGEGSESGRTSTCSATV